MESVKTRLNTMDEVGVREWREWREWGEEGTRVRGQQKVHIMNHYDDGNYCSWHIPMDKGRGGKGTRGRGKG